MIISFDQVYILVVINYKNYNHNVKDMLLDQDPFTQTQNQFRARAWSVPTESTRYAHFWFSMSLLDPVYKIISPHVSNVAQITFILFYAYQATHFRHLFLIQTNFVFDNFYVSDHSHFLDHISSTTRRIIDHMSL